MDEKVMLSSGGDDPIQIELTSNDVLLVNGHEASDQEIADALREILRRLLKRHRAATEWERSG